jgi:hypothetical protein
LSELRKRRCDPNPVAWIASVAETDRHISVISVAEIEFGIERQRKVDAVFAEQLARWFAVTLRVYSTRILNARAQPDGLSAPWFPDRNLPELTAANDPPAGRSEWPHREIRP